MPTGANPPDGLKSPRIAKDTKPRVFESLPFYIPTALSRLLYEVTLYWWGMFPNYSSTFGLSPVDFCQQETYKRPIFFSPHKEIYARPGLMRTTLAISLLKASKGTQQVCCLSVDGMTDDVPHRTCVRGTHSSSRIYLNE